MEQGVDQQSSTGNTPDGERKPPVPDTGPPATHDHTLWYERRSSLAWFPPRRPSGMATTRRSSIVLQRTTTGRRWWRFTLRDWDDDDEQDWWFASTAIPLLAATIAPLANVLSIAALVTYWRMCLVPGVDHADASQCLYDNGALNTDLDGITFADPDWCFWLNVVSLIVGFIGNFFLLCNFTNRIR